MKRFYLTILTLLIMATQPILAVSGIGLKFNRTGTDASTVTVTVVDENGAAIDGATATLTSTHSFKGTSNAVTAAILCPDVNATTSPTIDLTFTVSGVPAGFTFDKVGLDIHALNGGSNYQANNDNKQRLWNVATTVNNEEFGSLDDIDIAAGVGSTNAVHQVWDIIGETVNADGTVTVNLTITKGSANEGCFFGLSEVLLSTDGEEPTPEPEPEPDPEPAEGFVHYNTDLEVTDVAEYPDGVTTAKNDETTGEGCTTGSTKSAVTPVKAPMASDVTVTFQYQSGPHKLVILGVDLLDADGNVAKGDYHYGYTGGKTGDNTYTIAGVEAGEYQLRYFFCHKADDHEVGNQVAEITVTGLDMVEVEEPEPDPVPEPDATGAKVYLISWKNTGANYITEESDHRMTIQSRDNAKPQFWMFIPSENDGCYYIKNTATGRYIGSCDLTPSSASKVYTTTTPTEYYVGKTTKTYGENANCWWFSSTDCANYSSESAGPRALNKDGASSYVITWTAGVNNVGSYWQLIETEDLYEPRPYDGSTAIGNIGASYNVEAINGKYLSIADGNLALAVADAFDENQEWYFVGTGNTDGWLIASAAEPAVVVGIADGKITAGEGLDTKWKVHIAKENNGYYYFTSEGTTLKVEGDSLFKFNRLRSAYTRKLQIYNNPCGSTGTNYVKKFELRGEAAIDNIIYEASSKPGTWHVVYAQDKGEVAQGGKFNIDVTLSSNAASSLRVDAHFDWNADGIFEAAAPLTVNSKNATAEVTVPEWASEKQTRMRLRVNSNGLDLAEDEVTGFIYDFHIKVVPAQETRTVTVGVNSWERGKAELSQVAESYAYGTELTAKATAYGNGAFVCWKEEGVIVSTDAEYTFTVDHNVKLVAFFAPNTDESTYPTGIQERADDNSIDVTVTENAIVATDNVTSLDLYSVNAAHIAKAKGNTLSVAAVQEGLYIVRATTANGYKNVKIYIRK